MTGRIRRYSAAAIIVGIALFPSIGGVVAHRNFSAILSFPPPLIIPRDFPRFSWLAALLVVLPFAAFGWWWLNWNRRTGTRVSQRPTTSAADSVWSRMPWWGGAGLAWTSAWWLLAWTRLASFAPFQRYTFFPLWLGFIVVANALTFSVSGTCLMLRCPRRWFTLFAGSAFFWWVFEWLNRFTQNWHYLNVSDFGACAYAVHASLCFSTVLPAVTAVAEFLQQCQRWRTLMQSGPSLNLLGGRAAALLAIGGTIGLGGAGARPWLFYPALWSAPLALLLARAIVIGHPNIASQLRRGDWVAPASWGVAALICGVFWELWNAHSAAKWIYTVPYVDRWHLFEMPLLGYLGYLPFGVECYFVTTAVLGDVAECGEARGAITRTALRRPNPREPSR